MSSWIYFRIPWIKEEMLKQVQHDDGNGFFQIILLFVNFLYNSFVLKRIIFFIVAILWHSPQKRRPLNHDQLAERASGQNLQQKNLLTRQHFNIMKLEKLSLLHTLHHLLLVNTKVERWSKLVKLKKLRPLRRSLNFFSDPYSGLFQGFLMSYKSWSKFL